jgi:hypothetical protein
MLLKSLTQPQERRISIEIDEMACKALLLWMQSRQKFVGEVDFGGVSMTDEDWNAIFEDENEEQSDEEDSEENDGKGIDCDGGKISEEAAFLKDDNDVKSTGAPVLANSLINFLITGITKKYSALAGSWPVTKFTGKQLFFLTVHVKKKLEEIGFIVERLVADNAKVNVKLFKLLKREADNNDFQVTHPADPSRILFVSYDYTHILKNVRNQLIDRQLKWNETRLDFSIIKLLFVKTIENGLPLCRFLTRRHIDPTNFERMKVCYARDIFRPELVAALRCMSDMYQIGFENVEALTDFLEFFWKWFNYHDVCNLTQHYQQRLEMKKTILRYQ